MSDRPEYEQADRGAGILTQKDREYLLGDIDIAGSDERRRRQLIRERIENAILDFALILENLEKRDLEQVFDQQDVGWAYNNKHASIPAMIAFAYLADPEVFETRIQSGIAEAEWEEGWLTEVDVELEITKTRKKRDALEDLKQNRGQADVEAGHAMALYMRDEITEDVYEEVLDAKVRGEASNGTDGKPQKDE